MTRLPLGDLRNAVVALWGGANRAPATDAADHFLLCELGEHDARTEHAAHLWANDPPSAPALWFFWTGAGTNRVHRVDAVPWCPAVLRNVATGVVRLCTYFDHHAAAHSWGVTDPLGDLLAERVVSGDGSDDA
ncbi:hypothetical protein [Streptomyces sp. NPDC101181]|uniref:hypothetical protein n=1 Tax=Streptomyces sp. NPDC101181 TaxID=3366125 RepID=UPI00381EE737